MAELDRAVRKTVLARTDAGNSGALKVGVDVIGDLPAGNLRAVLAALKDRIDATEADAHYVHSQIAAAATWTVNHNLGKKPSVTVVDSGGNVVIGDVRHLSNLVLEVRFGSAFSGEALCN